MKPKRAVQAVSILGLSLLSLFELFKGYLEPLGLSESVTTRIEIGSALLLVVIIQNLMFHLSIAQAEEQVAAASARLQDTESIISDRLQGFESSISDTAARLEAMSGSLSLLSREQVYKELDASADAAEYRIYNTYLSMVPPDNSSPLEKKDYFRDLPKLAKRKKNVTFRRVVLMTPANKQWIESLLDDYAGLSNVSVAVYRKPADALLPLSLQFFDAERVFIMHATRPAWQPRDILIRDKTVVSLLDDYYEELWTLSHPVLDAGRKSVENLQYLLET